MHIYNEEAHEMARELASLTGESITDAVTRALRERLERAQGQRRETPHAVGPDHASLVDQLGKPYRSVEHGDLRYDERGLPL
ncbi:MAG: type II toxin-antitoxin system VapB family antitoxin [Dehalococcoidia bacterium]